MFDMAQIEFRLRRGGTLNGLNLEEERLLRSHARARGLSAEELRRRWAAAGPGTLTKHAPARVEAVLPLDLDDWPLAADQQDDDDDDTEVCGACQGNGRDAAGRVCKACGGTGKAPAPDDDDKDNKEAKGTARYEFNNFEEE